MSARDGVAAKRWVAPLPQRDAWPPPKSRHAHASLSRAAAWSAKYPSTRAVTNLEWQQRERSVERGGERRRDEK